MIKECKTHGLTKYKLNKNNHYICIKCSKDRKLKHRYGINSNDKLELLSIYNNECYICSSSEDLCIDHCHDSNRIRGILCRKCNAGIAMLKHAPELLVKAIKYLKR